MEHGCEHLEGSPIGKCSICERTVCGDCYRDLFSAMICDLHESLEDESAWALVGFYTEQAALAERRFVLEDQQIASLVVEVDEDSIELYVPVEEKDDAYAALSGATVAAVFCFDCKIQFAASLGTCPICGVKAADEPEEIE